MKICTALLAAALLASPLAMAAEDGGFYVGAGMGSFGIDYRETENSVDFTFKGDDTAFKLFGGYNFNRYIGTELEYFDGGTIDQSYDLGKGTTLDVDIDVTGFNLSVVGVAPIGERFTVFAKLGMVFWDVDFTEDYSGAITVYNDSGEDLSWGLGAGFDFTEQFGARVEYQAFEVHDLDTVDLISASVTWRF